MNISVGEIWFVNFPLEEDEKLFISRPVIVLNVEPLQVLSVKVTKTKPRSNDEYDIPIVYWNEANLRFKSTARVSKTIYINKNQFHYKIGTLLKDDWIMIQNAFMEYINNQ